MNLYNNIKHFIGILNEYCEGLRLRNTLRLMLEHLFMARFATNFVVYLQNALFTYENVIYLQGFFADAFLLQQLLLNVALLSKKSQARRQLNWNGGGMDSQYKLLSELLSDQAAFITSPKTSLANY